MNIKIRLIIFALLWVCASASYAERIRVEVQTANIRSGSGLGYEILWQVEKYHPLEIIKKSGGWFYCKDYEEDTGWIFESVVSSRSSVIVKNDNSHVRSGPGTEFDVIFTAEKGVSFKLIRQKGSWFHVQHSDGDRGWMHQITVW